MTSVTVEQSAETAQGQLSVAAYTSLALLFSFLWSTGFVAAKYGLLSSPPLFMMGFRFLLAGGVLLAIVVVLRRPLPTSGRDWARLMVLGLFSIGGFFGLTAVALQGVSAGTGAVLASTNPLMLALLAPFMLGERLGWQKAIGMLIAFGSVVAVMFSRMGGGESLLHMGLILLANMLMITGTIFFKRWRLPYDLAGMNAVQLLVGGVLLLVPSLLFEPVLTGGVRWDANFFAALAYQWFVLSWTTMLLYLFLLRKGDASKANTFLFLNPVFGVFLGALLLGEALRPFDFVGTAGVALGIWLVLRAK